jgi:hypothetical protein
MSFEEDMSKMIDFFKNTELIELFEKNWIHKQRVRDAIEHSKVNIKQGDDEFISKNQLLKELNLGDVE